MRHIATVRGKLKDVKDIQKLHDDLAKQAQPLGKSLGDLSHQPYLNASNPREYFAVDLWENKEGMQQFFTDPKMAEVFGMLFEDRPEINFYTEAGWYGW